eukprot:GFYU01009990.1.p1 GENE.GFYU01009990.1~~GFYU01009990.1.p1  ORF type:complete len:292 (-),score=105.09 GFYU01009990.1:63-938(-)
MVGVQDLQFEVDPKMKFWDLARAIRDSLVKELKSIKKTLYLSTIGDAVHNYSNRVMRSKIPYLETGSTSSLVNCSNVGLFPHKNDLKDFTVRDVFGINGVIPLSAQFTIWLRCVDGHLCFNNLAPSPSCDGATSERVLNSLASLMEEVADIDDSFTFEEYLNRPVEKHISDNDSYSEKSDSDIDVEVSKKTRSVDFTQAFFDKDFAKVAAMLSDDVVLKFKGDKDAVSKEAVLTKLKSKRDFIGKIEYNITDVDDTHSIAYCKKMMMKIQIHDCITLNKDGLISVIEREKK